MCKRNDRSSSRVFIIWVLVLVSVCVAALLAVLIYGMVAGNVILTVVTSVSLAVTATVFVVSCAAVGCRKYADENTKDNDCNGLLLEAYKQIMTPEKSSDK